VTLTNSKWITVEAATTEGLQAELERRKLESEKEAARRAEEQRRREEDRAKVAREAPARLRTWRKRVAELSADTTRPDGVLRGRARGALLMGDLQPVLESDAISSELQRISMDAGRLMGSLSGALSDECDSAECEAFAALYRRLEWLAGVSA